MSGKQCKKCKVYRAMESFISQQNGQETKNCHKCRGSARRSMARIMTTEERSANWRKWYVDHKDENDEYRRGRILKHFYGITIEDYNRMLNAQGGLCAICGLTEVAEGDKQRVKYLSVDHCHETDEVRGLLCRRCNSGLGFFSDDIKLLHKATNYLESYNAEILLTHN